MPHESNVSGGSRHDATGQKHYKIPKTASLKTLHPSCSNCIVTSSCKTRKQQNVFLTSFLFSVSIILCICCETVLLFYCLTIKFDLKKNGVKRAYLHERFGDIFSFSLYLWPVRSCGEFQESVYEEEEADVKPTGISTFVLHVMIQGCCVEADGNP